MPNCDVTAVSIATYTGSSTPGFGLFGVSSVSLSGAAWIDSYNPASGPYSAGSAQANGNVGTNGSATLAGSAAIHGNLDYGPSGTYSLGGGVSITGTETKLSSDQSYPVASAGSAATVNNNGSIPGSFLSGGNFAVGGSSSVSLGAGTYYFNNMAVTNSGIVNFNGAVTIHVNGTLAISGAGQVNTYNNLPSNLQIFGLSTGTMSVGNSGSLCSEIYAPDSPFTVSGAGAFYGAIIGNTIKVSGSGGVHYDGSNQGGSGSGGSSGTGTISTVQ